MTQKRRLGYYLTSLPERAVRAMAAGAGGLLYEATELLLPTWLRRSRFYQATVERMLRITVELVGGVSEVVPAGDMDVRELAVRKTAGNVIEFASFLAVGWSPLWLLAVAADLTGGTRAYLRALVAELKRDAVLHEDADVTSVEQLLDVLESTSGVVADTIDVPPLNVRQMRQSWHALRGKASELPDARTLARIYSLLQETAEAEGRSLRTVSSLIAAGAVRTGVQMGSTYVFDYYRDALRTIRQEDLRTYAERVAMPYLTVAARHFDPERPTYTGRLLRRLRRDEAQGDAE